MDHQRNRKSLRTNEKDSSEVSKFALTRNQQPFLNPLIVQKVLEYCKLNSEDSKSFSSLRLVCKVWDAECSKILRPQIEIPIPRLIEPYPNGLGWAGNRSYMICPLPATREFENIKISVTCDSSKDTLLLRWFSTMGRQVKSLHFICALTCFHQNEFLANVLRKWCPNLETLHLDGIQCFTSLIYMFEGSLDWFQSSAKCDVGCKSLKTLVISVVDDKEQENCRHHFGQIPPTIKMTSLVDIKYVTYQFQYLIDLLPERDLILSPEISNLFYQLIENGATETFFKTLGTLVDMFGIDWGILGHIFKIAPIQKLVINKLCDEDQSLDFLVFLLLQSGKIRQTLQQLEFQNAALCVVGLKTLDLLKFSLTRLRLDKIVWRQEAEIYLRNILKNSEETLTSFEIGPDILIYRANSQRRPKSLQIPFLPKLKSFRNKAAGLLEVSGLELLTNAPNLETCCIQNLRSEEDIRVNGHMMMKSARMLCANLDNLLVKDHPLRELSVNICLQGSQIKLLQKGLVNLVNVKLRIRNPFELLMEFLNGNSWKNLEAITVWMGKENKLGLEEVQKIDKDLIAKCFEKIKGLKFFELIFDAEEMCVLPVGIFTNGFANLRELRSLKISNLRIMPNEMEEIDQSVAHIPFVSFLGLTQFSKGELD